MLTRNEPLNIKEIMPGVYSLMRSGELDANPDFTIPEYIAREKIREELESAEIREKFYLMYHNFVSKYGILPNKLFITGEDRSKLLKAAGIQYYSYDVNRFMNMELEPTIADRSYVALVHE
ncbi:hypothetical protein [Cytobacillus oceanisediminis]|uniref:hypothetical protein n=1 Tax=Cytobacillus oceanisediminis TaxID=665099 RepID=UPI001FB44A95|nr:hypothetical protein [Cytobacillus oceanisediminis]UOE58152.1 hypothetical protein IRB79_26975 [Cytobacillus oceanisediminis]